MNPGTKRKLLSGFRRSMKVSPRGPEAQGHDPVTLWVICPPSQLWTEDHFQRAACFFMLMATPGHWLKGTGDYTLVQLTHYFLSEFLWSKKAESICPQGG